MKSFFFLICLLFVFIGSFFLDLKGLMKGDKISRFEGLLRKFFFFLDILNFFDVVENVWFLMILKLIVINFKLISWWRCFDYYDRLSVLFSYIFFFLNVDDLLIVFWIFGL